MPPMVIFTFLWDSDDIVSAWPNIFHFSYINDIRYFDGLSGVAGCATMLYFMWFILYTSFMLLIGRDLPRKYNSNGQELNPKWDTVFHSTMRQGVCIPIGKVFRGRSKAESLKLMEENNFDTIDFFIYMVAHAISALGAIYTIGYACFLNKWFHLCMMGANVALAVIRGGKRYTYYTTKMYSRTLRKNFAELIDNDNGNQAGNYTRLT